MRVRHFFALGSIVLILSGCYLPISGRVIDAATDRPIEGATVLVEWTKTIGYGLTRTESYKVAEAVTDKDGMFELPGCYSPLVNEPDLAIYKTKYVTWNSKNIFPSMKRREDFQWSSRRTYKLESFKESFSYIDHQGFTTGAINSTIGWESKRLFIKSFNDAEEGLVIREQEERDRNKKEGLK